MSKPEQLSYEEVLEREGKLVAFNSGVSMLPLLRQGRDLMVIVKKGGERCKKYDAVLYKSGGRYVMHRVIKVRENDYVIVGDNCRIFEYGITDDDILGILVAVVRDGKRELKMDSLTCRGYAHLWCDLFPLRAFLIRIRELVRAVLRRLKRLFDREKSR